MAEHDPDAHTTDAQDRAERTGTGRKRQVVILGGGFGGAYCASTLERKIAGLFDPLDDVEVILIDRHNYFIFYPLLVEAGTGGLQPSHAVVSIRRFLKRKARFIMGEVQGVDLTARTVRYRVVGEEGPGCCEVQYDHLVIALGTVTLQPPIPGLREFGYEMKSLAQAVALRDRAVQLLEHASAIDDPDKRRALLHLVVVGGGYTGIETAGEYEVYMKSAARYYPRLKPEDVKVTVVDRSDRILKVLDRELSEYSTRHLIERGIDLRLKTEVKEVGEDFVRLTDGTTIASHTLVWAAGIAPNPLGKELVEAGLPADRHGYLLADRDGRITGYDNVWGVGDLTVNPDKDGRAYPATAQAALGIGVAVGKNLDAVLRGRPTRPIDLTDKGSLAAFGRFDAIAETFGFRFTGFVAWFLWRTVYLMKMPGLGRKLRVAADWTMDLLSRRDYVELGVHRIVRANKRAAERERDPGAPHRPGPSTPGSVQPRAPETQYGDRPNSNHDANGDGVTVAAPPLHAGV